MKLKHFFQFALIGNFSLTLFFFFQQGLSSGVEVPHFDKVGHFIAFFVLALCVDFATDLKKAISVFALVTYGILVEVIQGYIPGREASIADIVADSAGVIAYFILAANSKLLQKFKAEAHGGQ